MIIPEKPDTPVSSPSGVVRDYESSSKPRPNDAQQSVMSQEPPRYCE
ncbi:hypothetical protein RSAG8_10747, partial [Rhizoctonia solani AG-8 WAC10335]